MQARILLPSRDRRLQRAIRRRRLHDAKSSFHFPPIQDFPFCSGLVGFQLRRTMKERVQRMHGLRRQWAQSELLLEGQRVRVRRGNKGATEVPTPHSPKCKRRGFATWREETP